MGFDHVLSAPLFAPGARGDVFLTGDHEKLHPAIDASMSAQQGIRALAQDCEQFGLGLLLDIVLGRVAQDSKLAQSHPDWFASTAPNGHAVDPRAALPEPAAAYLRFDEAAIADDAASWWIECLLGLADAGVAGFCFAQPHLVPPAVWRRVIGAVRESFPELRFIAWTPGMSWAAVAGLRGAGFDGAFSSAPWWDGRASWLVEEHEVLRTLGSVIASPETPFGPRLGRRFGNLDDPLPLYRHMVMRAAAIGDGLMVPMGFEYAATQDMDAWQTKIDQSRLVSSGSNVDLSSDIRQANALSDRLAALHVNGEMRSLTDPVEPVTVLLRSDASSLRNASTPVVVVVNTDLHRERALPIVLKPLPPAASNAFVAQATIHADRDANGALAPGEIRVLDAQRSEPIKLGRPNLQPAKLASAKRIVIDNIVPAVEGGRFAAKRVVGEAVVIEADVFADGHEVLGVELLWRSADRKDWRRLPMQLINNDRWRATIHPERVGRYEFTVEAWIDTYGTFAREINLKRTAGADLSNEIAEGRQLLERANERLRGNGGKVIASSLQWLANASAEESVDILLTRDLREVMDEAEEREFSCRRKQALPLEVERPQALFASWYELFPRSAAPEPGRHGTFNDVIARLPALRDMGFDVLYLPPIHPIGTTNRKGKNNALHAAAGDLGSPYAIGSSEGGHTAIHPALGTIEDFRRLRDAAAAHGMELALDFAI